MSLAERRTTALAEAANAPKRPSSLGMEGILRSARQLVSSWRSKESFNTGDKLIWWLSPAFNCHEPRATSGCGSPGKRHGWSCR